MLNIWFSYILDALLALAGLASLVVSLVRDNGDYTTICFRVGGIAILLFAAIIFILIRGNHKMRK